MHFLALTDERGRLIWISAARPGRSHGITVARRDHLLAHLSPAGLGALADLGLYAWTTTPTTPWPSPASRPPAPASSPPARREANRVLASGRAQSSTASPTSRTGGPSPNSALTPPAPPTSCESCSSEHRELYPDALTPHDPRGTPGEADRLQTPTNRDSRSSRPHCPANRSARE
ncbi:transposase family protein [Streptomyces sp. AC550_RSS872]|uniref:transposase family protein n=1 Tax=Streptomyces sp. AC550_RSS872 TaxID=2823689 RepID=UPI001C27517D